MKRWAFNLAATVSLLLFLTAVALWVRGYFVTDSLEHKTLLQTSQGDPVEVTWVLDDDGERTGDPVMLPADVTTD